MKEQTLAQRCYNESAAQDELFEIIHYILGGADLAGCSKEDFKWRVYDVSTDYYDESVEVILDKSAEPLTREEVDKILDLGFGQVYESQGEGGIQWTRTYSGKCSANKGGDDNFNFRKMKSFLQYCIQSLEALEKYMPSLLNEAGLDLDDEEWIQVAIDRKNRASKYLQKLTE